MDIKRYYIIVEFVIRSDILEVITYGSFKYIDKGNEHIYYPLDDLFFPKLLRQWVNTF